METLPYKGGTAITLLNPNLPIGKDIKTNALICCCLLSGKNTQLF